MNAKWRQLQLPIVALHIKFKKHQSELYVMAKFDGPDYVKLKGV